MAVIDQLERLSTRRDEHPPVLRADFFKGDKFLDGMRLQVAHSAILGVNNVTHSKGVIAGAIDNIADVGVGGRSDDKNNAGVYGYSENGTGVYCKSVNYEALHAETQSSETAAIAAYNMNPDSQSAALYAKKFGTKGYAAVFEGDVIVSVGNLNIKSGLLQINGESVWELISNLQLKVQELGNLLIHVSNKADAAGYEANKANGRIDAL